MRPLEDRELLNQTMVGLNIDADTITSLMASFDSAAENLESNPIAPVDTASFGDSHTGGYRLGTNAEMAHEAAGAELLKLVAGLKEMAASVGMIADDMQNVTDQTQATVNRITVATDCVAAPDFALDQCTLPTERD